MIDNSVIVKVTNRFGGTVGYTLPDSRIHRNFQAYEKKDISMGELRSLSYAPGGLYLLQNCLILDNKHAIAELLG